MKQKISIFRLFKEVFAVSPGRFCLQYALTIVGAVSLALVPYATEQVFSSALSLVDRNGNILSALCAIGSLLLLNMGSEIASFASIYHSQTFDSMALQDRLKGINCHMAHIPNIAFENPEILNLINGAYIGAQEVRNVVHSVMEFLTFYIPYIAIYSIYLWSVSSVLLLAIPAIFIPSIIAQIVKAKQFSQLSEDATEIRRELECYASYVTEAKIAKETRILGAINYFLTRYRKVRSKLGDLVYQVKKKTMCIETIAKFLNLLGYAAVIALLIALSTQGWIEIGAFAAVFATIGTLIEHCNELIGQKIGDIAEAYGDLRQYTKIFSLPAEASTGEKVRNRSLVLENISFSYPCDEQKNVISDVSFSICESETIALVGENGSGKTTLAKILLGLYEPTQGAVYRDGVQSNYVDKVKLFDQSSALFQAFGKYRMTLEENINLTEKELSLEEELAILNNVGIDIYSDVFPQGLSTVLSKEFGGVDLSGGQWQRISIARALFKRSSFLVLDEPTSAIDPMQEHSLYHLFLDAVAEKTAVIITHRLGLARMCDRIVVMKDGVIFASGTHETLLQDCDYYASLWHSQSDQYS